MKISLSYMKILSYIFLQKNINAIMQKTVEKSHERIEVRECYSITDICWLEQKKEWSGISGIGMIKSKVQTVGQDNCETAVHFVIYSKSDMTATQLLTANAGTGL